MKIRASDKSEQIHQTFQKKFKGDHTWKYLMTMSQEWRVKVMKLKEK